MNSSFKIRYLAAGILALLWGLETDAVSQTRSRVRDHRGSENNKEPKIKLPPLEGPTTQWRLLSTPASEKVSSPSDTRYRLTALAPLQLTVNPMTVNSKKDDSELQLSPINAPGMRANITVQPNSSTPGLELNRPFAMYLPEQRAYIFYREQIRAAGEITLHTLPEPGSVSAPDNLRLFKWDPARSKSRVPPAFVFQWEFQKTGDHTTRKIASQRSHTLKNWYDVTEMLALLNTQANAYLVYDVKQRRVGWRQGHVAPARRQ